MSKQTELCNAALIRCVDEQIASRMIVNIDTELRRLPEADRESHVRELYQQQLSSEVIAFTLRLTEAFASVTNKLETLLAKKTESPKCST